MIYRTILTNVGLATIAAVTAGGGKITLRDMAVGDGGGNDVEPSPNQSSLVRETYRASISYLSPDPKNPNQLIAEIVIPSSVGGFVIREIGLFDEHGNLIAVGNHPATVKPVPDSGALVETRIRVTIAVGNTADFQIVVDPTIILATRDWCQDNFSLSIQLPGGTTGQVLRKKTNTDGDFEWYDPASGMTVLVHSIEENQQLVAGQTDITLSIATTNGAAVYIDGKRLRADEWTTVSSNQLRLNAAAAAAARITILQNEQLGTADFLRTANRLSEFKTAGAAAQSAALANLGLPEGGLDALTKHILGVLHPIGSLYTTTATTDPALTLGFGTWERYGAGRAIVGMDSSDTDFNAIGKTGGAKTATLTAAQLPAVSISIPQQTLQMNPVSDHVHTYAIDKEYAQRGSSLVGDAPGSGQDGSYGAFNTSASGGHTPSGIVPAHKSDLIGSGQVHTNLQPYVVVAVWRRIA